MAGSELTRENRLLAGLPRDEYQRLSSALEPVSLGREQVLCGPDEPIAYLYFPRTAMVSLTTTMQDNSVAEVATIGREGFIGLPLVLGAASAPTQVLCQIPGEAARMPARAVQPELERSEVFARRLLLYTQALFNQVAQLAACNRLHPVQGRCARRLLTIVDCAGETFPLTQESLAQMLGTRRAAVSAAAGGLRQAGAIRYARGTLSIADRRRLESAACECYRKIATQYELLLGGL
jgi:CRP-like cAMP-binding protein